MAKATCILDLERARSLSYMICLAKVTSRKVSA
jgi:hypothetical protein